MSKELLTQFNEAFSDFKAKNDERLVELEKNKHEPALLKESLAKIEKDLDAIENKIEAKQVDIESHIAKMQEAIDRAELAPKDKPSLHKDEAFSFYKELIANSDKPVRETSLDDEGKLVNITDDAVKAYQNYKPAFIKAAKNRFSNMPADLVNVMSVGSQPGGGYLVPADMTGRIVEFVYESSPMRQYANVETVGTDRKTGGYDLDELVATWEGELSNRTETATPKLGEYTIHTHEVYAEPRITFKALEDSQLDLASWLVRKIASQFLRAENAGFVTGNGVGQPRGFTTYPAGEPTAANFERIEQVASGVAYTAANGGISNADAFISLEESLKGIYQQNAIYAMKRSTRASVRKLKDGQGNYLYQRGQGGASALLNEYPIVLFNDMAAPGTNSLSIAFGDFREAYTIIDRLGLTVLVDNLTSSNSVKYKARKRSGGQVVNFEAIKLLKFAASV